MVDVDGRMASTDGEAGVTEQELELATEWSRAINRNWVKNKVNDG